MCMNMIVSLGLGRNLEHNFPEGNCCMNSIENLCVGM